VLVVGIVIAGSAALYSAARTEAVGGPPPGWTASDWATLSPSDQTVEWTDYDDGSGTPAEKAPWLDANPDTGDPALDTDPTDDGAIVGSTNGTIDDSRQSPFGSKYVINNEYQEVNAAGTVLSQFFAGDLATWPCPPRDPGVVVINDLAYPGDGSQVGTVTEKQGLNTGPITFTSVSGRSLLFTTGNGSTGSINIDTRQMTIVAATKAQPSLPCS
jgi:hypothetical protein